MKDIEGYEGLYQVSDTGLVKSLRNNKHRILKSCATRHGYLLITFSINKKRKAHTVHRLVLNAFTPKSEKNLQCNHKDGNKLNNRISNLEWCSQSENMKHAIKLGLRQGWRGENNPKTKFSKFQIQRMRLLKK